MQSYSRFPVSFGMFSGCSIVLPFFLLYYLFWFLVFYFLMRNLMSNSPFSIVALVAIVLIIIHLLFIANSVSYGVPLNYLCYSVGLSYTYNILLILGMIYSMYIKFTSTSSSNTTRRNNTVNTNRA